MSYILAAESVIHAPAGIASTGSVLEIQNLRPHQHLQSQNQHLTKILDNPYAHERCI